MHRGAYVRKVNTMQGTNTSIWYVPNSQQYYKIILFLKEMSKLLKTINSAILLVIIAKLAYSRTTYPA